MKKLDDLGDMNILITSAGRRGSLVKIFQKELLKYFPLGKVFTADMEPFMSSACRLSDRYFNVPKVSRKDYITSICNIVKRNNIRLLIPTIDSELLVLSENKNLLEDIGCKVVISDVNLIKQCRDKRKTSLLFSTYGISVPLFYNKQNYKLPVFVKPFDGSRSVDTFIVKDQSQMQKRFIEEERFMLMEYVDHEKYVEYTVDAYYNVNSQLKFLIPRERIEVRDGEVNKGITRKNDVYRLLIKNLSNIKGARGVLTIQFFINKDNHSDIYGIEVNPRLGGGAPLTYYAGGNFVKNIIKEYILNESIEWEDNWEDSCLMLRYDAEVIIHGYKAKR